RGGFRRLVHARSFSKSFRNPVLSLSVSRSTRRSLWNCSKTSEFGRSLLISRLNSTRMRPRLFLHPQRFGCEARSLASVSTHSLGEPTFDQVLEQPLKPTSNLIFFECVKPTDFLHFG